MAEGVTGQPTNHGKQVRVIDGSFLLVAVPQTRAVEHSSHRQTEVGSVSVDDHGGAHVVGLSQRGQQSHTTSFFYVRSVRKLT